MILREIVRRPAIKILCSIALLAIASRLLDWRSLVDSAMRLDAWHLGVALAGSILVLIFSAARWALMASELIPGVMLRHARNYLLGIFIGIVTPANIGADLYRFGSFPKTGSAWPIVTLLLQEKVFILLGYLLSVMATLLAIAVMEPALPRDQEMALIAVGTASFLGTAVIFALHPLIAATDRARLLSGRLSRVLDTVRAVAALGSASRRFALIGLSLLSVTAWICAVSAIASTVRDTLPLLVLWLVAILADIARWMPLSLQGIGVREAAFATMFVFFGADSAQGFVIGATAYVLLTIAMVISGGLAVGFDMIATLRSASRRAAS
jgi:glycosyltransferase 2 family protein